MTLRFSGAVVLMAAMTIPARRAVAQTAVGNMVLQDSLAPAKIQLRDFVSLLNDSLTSVEAIRVRVTRARRTGMDAVVLSMGRTLGRACHSSDLLVQSTDYKVGYMKTSDPHGDQALAAYRASLEELSTNLQSCRHDDSVVMAAASPDPARIEQVSSDVTDAIVRYNGVRDALLRLLGIQLPARGNIRGARQF